MLNWLDWVGCGGVSLYFYRWGIKCCWQVLAPAPVWMKYELQCQLNLSQSSWDELMIREQRCALMCCICGGGLGVCGGGSEPAHYHTLYTQRIITDGQMHSHWWLCSPNASHFSFFSTWKILQLNAARLYFPLVNFKCLLPFPLKAPCTLRLRFCALHSDEEKPFLL